MRYVTRGMVFNKTTFYATLWLNCFRKQSVWQANVNFYVLSKKITSIHNHSCVVMPARHSVITVSLSWLPRRLATQTVDLENERVEVKQFSERFYGPHNRIKLELDSFEKIIES